MRSERRATRNRLYTLTGGLIMVVLGLVALSSLAGVGRHVLDTSVYPWPHKTLQALAQAQERFRLQDLDEDGVQDYAASLEELEAAGQITRTLTTGTVHGYRYRVEGAEGGTTYAISAAPDVAAVGTGGLFYRIDRSHVVRAAFDGPATPQSEMFWHPVHGDCWPAARPAALGKDGRPRSTEAPPR